MGKRIPRNIMRKLKRILTLTLAMITIATTGLIGITASAASTDYATKYVIDPLRTVDVVVHKYLMDDHIQSMKENNAGENLIDNNKQVSTSTTAKPLAGIKFKAYPLDESGNKIKHSDAIIQKYRTDYASRSSAATGEKLTSALVNTIMSRFKKDGAGYIYYDMGVATDTTGTLNINSLFQGKWSIEEVADTTKVASTALPTVIELPITNVSNQSEWLYRAHIYPKNEDIHIVKDIQHLGNNHHTADIYEPFSWIVTTDVPDDIYKCSKTLHDSDNTKISWAGYSRFNIIDDLDMNIKYKGTTKVCVVTGSTSDTTVGTEKNLTYGTDYTIAVTDGKGTQNSKITWSITESGRQKLSPVLLKQKGVKLRIYFESVIRNTIGESVLGKPLKNKAKLEFTNSSGVKGTRESDIPEVHTTGIKIYKLDEKTQKPIAGTVFKIASSEENARNGVFLKQWILNASDNSYVRGENDIVVTTDENGCALFKGLYYGTKATKYNNAATKGTGHDSGETTYWVVEVKSSKDSNGFTYQLQPEPIKVTANSTSHLQANAVKVYDGIRTVLTGGNGALLFGLVGVTAVGIGVLTIAFVATKKKKSAKHN